MFKRVLKSAIIGSASYYPNMLLLIDWDEYCANVAKLLPIINCLILLTCCFYLEKDGETPSTTRRDCSSDGGESDVRVEGRHVLT